MLLFALAVAPGPLSPPAVARPGVGRPLLSQRRRAEPSMQIGQQFGNFMKSMTGGDSGTGLSKEEEQAMEERFKTGGMSFDDFLTQALPRLRRPPGRCSLQPPRHRARR